MSYSGNVYPPPPSGSDRNGLPKGQYRDPGVTLLLSLVTCGIYYLYYIYIASAEANAYLGERDTDPMMEVILSLVTCFLYTIYWDYKMAHKIAKMQEIAGVRVIDNAILYLVLNFLGVGFLPHLIQQGQLNEIWAQPV